MAGALMKDGSDICFVPRFAFAAGTTYDVEVDGAVAVSLRRPRAERAVKAQVIEIYPTATKVPRNLLRIYVQFSTAMSEGNAARCIRLEEAGGDAMEGALLATSDELWDADHRRLTLLLDPARIKRGLAPHREVGYSLQSDSTFRVVVDRNFRDAEGIPLGNGSSRTYRVGQDERRHIDPTAWTTHLPETGTRGPLSVAFDRPLDRGLLQRCLTIVAPDGRIVDGTVKIGNEERSWNLEPAARWGTGFHYLSVAPILEDVAGNSVTRVFDRDMTNARDAPRDDKPVTLRFTPNAKRRSLRKDSGHLNELPNR
jgi:hypothetical protein